MSVSKDTHTGKWIAKYYVKQPDGALKSTTKRGLPTRDAAIAWELTHKHNDIIVSHTLTFAQMYEEMARHSDANETTNTTRRNRLIKYCPDLWNRPIRKITKAELHDARAKLRSTKLATSTVNDTIGFIKQVFRYAEKTYDIPDVSRVLEKYKRDKNDGTKEMHILTYEQFRLAMDQEENDLCRDFFTFLYKTGCRKGEARALYKSDWIPSIKSVHITKAMRRGPESIKDPKNEQSIRYVPVDDRTAEMLDRLAARKGLFLFGDYSPMNLNTIAAHFKKDLKEAGLNPDTRIHDLRHSHVSILWHNRVPIPEISKRIGHSSPKVTMERYAHIFDNTQSASLAVLNSLE